MFCERGSVPHAAVTLQFLNISAHFRSMSRLGIYFCGSIRGGREDVDLYQRIVAKLDKYGEVLTPFVAGRTSAGRRIGHASL